jgi:small-conductance mechanosensitive channel
LAILRTLDAAGIEIPFPQRDLHIRYAPPGPVPGMPLGASSGQLARDAPA